MDVKQDQLLAEQKVVLQTLAESVAKPACKFLEIGSWVGDSTVVLAKVAQQHGGHLFCVDWWKGNPGTELVSIAFIQDVFGVFWSRIRQEGLEDTVTPIRSDSSVASEIFKKGSFEIVFIDADHRYEATLRDIKQYAPLVSRKKGILCGHDCEGRISDFDRSFLKAGKDVDYYESVHCGVVLAVGTSFKDYSIEQGLWSIRATDKKDGWEPTNLRFAVPVPLGNYKDYNFVGWLDRIYGIPRKLGHVDLNNEKHRGHPGILSAKTRRKVESLIDGTQRLCFDPKVIGTYKDYNLVKWWNRIYGIHRSLGHVDLNNEKRRNHPGVSSAETRQKVKRLIDKAASLKITPELVGTYKNYNIVKWWNRVYGIHQSLGRIDIGDEKYHNHPGILSAETQQKLKRLIDKTVSADVAIELVDTYKGYNIIRWWNRICGVHQSLGRIDFTLDSINEKNEDSKWFIGDSYSEVRNLIHQVQCKEAQEKLDEAESRVGFLQKESAARAEELAGLRSELEKTQKEYAARGKELAGLRGELEKTKAEYESMRSIMEKELRIYQAQYRTLTEDMKAQSGYLEEQQKLLSDLRSANIFELTLRKLKSGIMQKKLWK